jgi:hypothetical protein
MINGSFTAGRLESGKAFFSEEKKQKTFLILRSFDVADYGRTVSASAALKVFWFFSSEKNILSFHLPWLKTWEAGRQKLFRYRRRRPEK